MVAEVAGIWGALEDFGAWYWPDGASPTVATVAAGFAALTYRASRSDKALERVPIITIEEPRIEGTASTIGLDLVNVSSAPAVNVTATGTYNKQPAARAAEIALLASGAKERVTLKFINDIGVMEHPDGESAPAAESSSPEQIFAHRGRLAQNRAPVHVIINAKSVFDANAKHLTWEARFVLTPAGQGKPLSVAIQSISSPRAFKSKPGGDDGGSKKTRKQATAVGGS